MWKSFENCAPLTIDIGSKPCASEKPPKRSIMAPADCTAEKASITRKPRASPTTSSPDSASRNAPTSSDT